MGGEKGLNDVYYMSSGIKMFVFSYGDCWLEVDTKSVRENMLTFFVYV